MAGNALVLLEQIWRLPEVVGIGRGPKVVRGNKSGQEALVVLVKRKLPLDLLATTAVIPPEVGGVSTDVIEVGELRMLGNPTLPSPRRVPAGNGPPLALEAQPATDGEGRRRYHRPIQPGMSIGHFRVTAGTLGAIVRDATTSTLLILSNNHVLANTSNGRDRRARRGDPILQPGPTDGGRRYPPLAYLERFVPLVSSKSPPRTSLLAGGRQVDAAGVMTSVSRNLGQEFNLAMNPSARGFKSESSCPGSFFNSNSTGVNLAALQLSMEPGPTPDSSGKSQSHPRGLARQPWPFPWPWPLFPNYRTTSPSPGAGLNLVDAAIARPIQPEAVRPEILGLGKIQGTARATLGDQIWKSGRTSDVTGGQILAVEVTAKITLPTGQIANFVEQFITTPLAQPGDSGSLIVDSERRALGLLCAGSDRVTVANDIDHVLGLLNITI